MREYGVSVRVEPGGKAFYRVYRTEDGITRTPFGPEFETPKAAYNYADLSAGKPNTVSPLRSAMGSTASPSVQPIAERITEPLSSAEGRPTP